MAFYKDVPTSHPQKKNYANQGSWDDEGAHYRAANRRFGPESGDERRSNRAPGRSFGARPGDSRRPYGERRNEGECRPYGERGGSSRPSQGRGNRDERRGTGRPVERRPREERRPAPVRQELSYRDFEQLNPYVEEKVDATENLLAGRNPIREALKSGRDLEKLLVQRGELSGSAREIVQMAKEARVPVQEVDKSRLDAIAPHHQGMLAFASAYHYAEVEDMLAVARERGEEPFLILLDGVTDPHNLGAIIRSAECAGAHGVIVPQRRSVGLTTAAVKASAGAVEHMKVARVTNLNRTIEALKTQGIWVYAVTMDGQDYERVNFKGGVALVIGAEGEGISRLTVESCDQKVSLPMAGRIDSLNASVAAGVMMYRVLSSRRA